MAHFSTADRHRLIVAARSAPSDTVVPLSAPAGVQRAASRVVWVDSLRTVMILLVVNMHACVTYSHVGSWYFMVSPEPSLGMKIPFAFWQGHLQAFFMGLLFFVSGYFADRSLAKKTTGAFLAERFRRLAVPTLFYMLVLHPIIVFGLLTPAAERPTISWYFTDYIGKGKFIGSSGPMWFAFALLLFCVPFALFGHRTGAVQNLKPLQLKAWAVIGLGVGLSIGTFLVRTWQPMGTSIINFQFCYFTQYIVVFCLGVWVSRRNSLEAIAASSVARRAGWLALVLGPIALAVAAGLMGPDLGKNPPPMNGGWNWEALALAFWEQCAGVGLGLGALALCSRVLNAERPLMRWLSDRSFGMYLLHAPILVALAIAMQGIHASMFLMTLVLTVLGWVLSAFAADLVRRIPYVKAFV